MNGDLQGNSKVNFSSMDEYQILRSSLSQSILNVNNGDTTKSNMDNISGLDLYKVEKLGYNELVNTRNQKLMNQTKNTLSHEQIASGENIRSSQYMLENTWVSKKPQDTGFITT